jgi:hypothetical protein
VTTADVVQMAYARKILIHGRRPEPHDYRLARRALELIAVRIGRGGRSGQTDAVAAERRKPRRSYELLIVRPVDSFGLLPCLGQLLAYDPCDGRTATSGSQE